MSLRSSVDHQQQFEIIFNRTKRYRCAYLIQFQYGLIPFVLSLSICCGQSDKNSQKLGLKLFMEDFKSVEETCYAARFVKKKPQTGKYIFTLLSCYGSVYKCTLVCGNCFCFCIWCFSCSKYENKTLINVSIQYILIFSTLKHCWWHHFSMLTYFCHSYIFWSI